MRLLSAQASLALFGLVVVSGALSVALSGCDFGKSLGSVDAGVADAGPQVIVCTASFPDPASECPAEIPECSFGVCKRPCAASEACTDPSTFCNGNTGYCEPGCRDSSTCAGGTVCSVGSCIVSTGCITKCDCVAGQVCTNGSCTEAPGTCTGIDQCGRGADGDPCEDLICNSFTQLCFDDDPTPCEENVDCVGRPGCAGGCTCTSNGNCVPEVACTEGNEATTCGAGNYCDGNGSCQAAPACASEAECTSVGLTCNTAGGVCQRSNACASNADCTVAPATYCNPTTDFCAQPLCTNGGTTCTGTEQCQPDGRCVPVGSGGACTSDATCAPTEYCAPGGGAQGACTVGCRNNASCGNASQVCNGAHTCVGGGGGDLGGVGENCAGDEECQNGLVCGLFTQTCTEPCEGSDCAVDNCCPLSGRPCCSGLGFCSDIGC